MEAFLGIVLPSLTAFVIRLCKATNNFTKVLISMGIALVVAILVCLLSNPALDVEKIFQTAVMLYGISQGTYQAQKAIRKK